MARQGRAVVVGSCYERVGRESRAGRERIEREGLGGRMWTGS